MFQQPFGMPAHDPSTAQIPHETLNVIQDIESRLLALKIGIAQTNPQLAPVLLWREQAIAALAGRVPMIGAPSLLTPGVAQSAVPAATALASIQSLLNTIGAPIGVPSAFSPSAFSSWPVSNVLPSVSPFAPALGSLLGVPVGFPAGVVSPFGIATPFRY